MLFHTDQPLTVTVPQTAFTTNQFKQNHYLRKGRKAQTYLPKLEHLTFTDHITQISVTKSFMRRKIHT